MRETMPIRPNLTPTRYHRIKSDYGMMDYFWDYRKRYKNYNISRELYPKILRSINEKIFKEIVNKPYDFRIPKRLGYIKIRKYYPEFSVVGNKVVKNKMMIDFPATFRLWESDPDAYEKKILLYYENDHSDGFVFKIKYDKRHSFYKNRSVYMFAPTRKMKNLLGKNIKNKTIDAFLL